MKGLIRMQPYSPAIEELRLLQALRLHQKRIRHNYPQDNFTNLLELSRKPTTLGQKLSDALTKYLGSWLFIATQSICILAWIGYNIYSKNDSWDPYPFIFLNLLLSFQAAYTAPVIMMSQNRQYEIDRQQMVNGLEVNFKAELEIELLHQKIDMMREKEFLILTKSIQELSKKIDANKTAK